MSSAANQIAELDNEYLLLSLLKNLNPKFFQSIYF